MIKIKQFIFKHKLKRAKRLMDKCNEFNRVLIKCCDNDDFEEFYKKYPGEFRISGKQYVRSYLEKLHASPEDIDEMMELAYNSEQAYRRWSSAKDKEYSLRRLGDRAFVHDVKYVLK